MPNFFLEVKAPDGSAGVARKQALYDGAIGARAMHSLQNYGREGPVYDGNAYTLSSTYHAGTGTLQMYAHHPTEPTTPGGPPEYHMTQVKAYAMTSDRNTCVEGLKAFRNGRKWTKKQRDRFIEAANTRARGGVEVPSAQEDDATEVQQEGSSSEEFVDCEEFVDSQDHGGLPLQDPVDYNDDAAYQDNEGSAIPQYLHAEDEDQSQESVLHRVEPPTSFATSFTSSFTSSFNTQTRSKRPRTSQSPPSSSRQHKKHGSKSQTCTGTSRGTSKVSTQASTSTSTSSAQGRPAATAKDYWIWSNRRENWYHLRKDGFREWYKGE